MPLWERRPVRVERRRRRGRGGGTRGRGCACGEPSRAPSPRAGPGGPEHGCIRVAIMNKSNKQRTSEQPHSVFKRSNTAPIPPKCQNLLTAPLCAHMPTSNRNPPATATRPKNRTEACDHPGVEFPTACVSDSAWGQPSAVKHASSRRARTSAPDRSSVTRLPSRVIARPHLCGTAITARCTAGASFAVTVSSSSSAP